MAVALVATGVQFPDSTIQTTAAGAGGAPAMVYLAGVNGNAATMVNLEYTFTSTYDMHVLVISDVRRSVNVGNGSGALRMQYRFGSSYEQGQNYRTVNEYDVGSLGFQKSGFSLQTDMTLGATYANADPTNVTVNGMLYFPMAGSASSFKKHFGHLTIQNNNGVMGSGDGGVNSLPLMRVTGGNSLSSPGVLTGMRFWVSSGEGLNGSFRLYGITNS